MGHLDVKKEKNKTADLLSKEESLITPGFDEKEEKKGTVKKQEKAVKSEKEKTYERILKNSLDKNTALQVKNYDNAEKGDWNVIGVRRTEPFRQKLPAARDTIKARRAENNAKSEAKRTFRNADLCTVREKHAMEQYFAKWKNGDPGVQGVDEPDDPALTEYVESILNMELNNNVFTDDYLSDHMAEMWEYTRKLSNLSYAREKYPKFFAHLSDDKKALLENRAAAINEMRTVLKDHMHLHGIVLQRGTNGFTVSLREESENNEERNAARARLKEKYDRTLGDFLKGRVYEDEVNLARTYTGLDSFKTKTAAADIEERMAGSERAKEVCKSEMLAASEEMKKAWEVRDDLLVEQRQLLGRYDSEQNSALKAELRAKIVRNNRRIRLATQHADHYKDFIDFVTGVVPMVKKGTAKFLEGANQKDMLDIVRIKVMGDCLEESLTASDRIEKKKELDELKKKRELEAKESGIDDFELIDIKDESAAKIRALEEEINGMTYVRMPLDMFYSKVAAFQAAKEKGRKFKELKVRAEKNRNAAMKLSKKFAGESGAIKTEDRYLTCFSYPFENLEDKVDKPVPMDFTGFEAFSLFTGYKDGKTVKPEARSAAVKSGKAFLDELMAIKPEDMLEYRCPADPDIESPEFWKKMSFVWALHDYRSTLGSFANWNISLTDEQYAHIMGLSKMAQGMVRDYRLYEAKLEDPVSVIADDPRLAGERLEKAQQNIFFPYRDDGEPADKEAADRLRRFSKERSGVTLNIFMDTKRKDTNAIEAVSYYAYEKYLSSDKNLSSDDLEEYDKEKKDWLDKPKDASVEEELKKMREFFPDAGEEEARTRLQIKEHKKYIENAMSDEQIEKWRLMLGNNMGNSADHRSFSFFLRPVQKDKNGILTEEGRKNKELNEEDINDYISVDIKRRNRVLRRIGKEMLDINFTDEMLTFDYLQKNSSKLYPLCQKILCFQNIWKDHADFFESDAFTEEERDRLRKYMTNTQVPAVFSSIIGNYCESFTKEDSYVYTEPAAKAKNKKAEAKDKAAAIAQDKLKWGLKRKNTYVTTCRMMFELDDPEAGIAGALRVQKKRAELYETKADEIRRASVLWAKTKTEREKVIRERGRYLEKEHSLPPESAIKDKYLAEKDKVIAEYDAKLKEAEDKLKLCEEIQSFVYEEKEDLSPEAQILYDTQMNESVIHAEYIKSYDEKNAELKELIKKNEDELKALNLELERKKAEKAARKTDPYAKKGKIVAKDALAAAMSELLAEEGEQEEGQEKPVEELSTEEQHIEKEQEKPVEQEIPAAGQVQITAQKKQGGAVMKASDLVFQPLPQYNVSAELASPYQQQGKLNCWACTGAAIFNKFSLLQDGELKDEVDQYHVRAFSPDEKTEMKTKDQIRATGLKVDDDLYDEYKERMVAYMGEGKEKTGNVFEVADFFMKKRTDFAMNRMLIHVPGYLPGKNQPPKTEEDKVNDAIKHYNQKVAFVNKLNEVLSTGNLVSFYFESYAHYVTITGLNGNEVTFMDSLGNVEKKMTVDDMLKRNNKGLDVELTWFSKLPEHDELLNEYPLLYNEATGEYTPVEHTMEEALNLAHTKGTLVGRSDKQLGENMEGISIATYFPKYMNQAPDPVQQPPGGEEMQQDGGQKQKEEKKEENKINEEQKQEEQKQEEEKKEENRINEEQHEEKKATVKEPIIREEKKQGENSPIWDIEKDKAKISESIEKMDTVIYQRADRLIEKYELRPAEWKKTHIDKESQGGRKAKGICGALAYFKGDSEDQNWETYNGLMVYKKNALPEQKKAMSRALERVFEMILEFDLDNYNIKDRNDLLSEDLFDARLMCYTVHEIPPEYFRDYLELIKDPESDCVLDEAQLKEVRCKWETIYDCATWFTDYPKIAAGEGFTKTKIDNLFNTSIEELMTASSNAQTKEEGTIYNSAILLVQGTAEGGYKPGDKIEERYEAHRNKAGLGKDNISTSALDAIRNREKTKGALPKDPTDREMTAEEVKQAEIKEAERLQKVEQRLNEQEAKKRKKGVMLRDDLYTAANKSAIKKGKFSKEFLEAGNKFMLNVDSWALTRRDLDQTIFEKMGIRDTVDMLYVSGVPIKKFVAERYDYKGDDVQILRVYAAMIAGRQKYPIVMARPVLDDKGGIDVMIEALSINSEELGAKKSKTGSEEYKKAQADAVKKVKYSKETSLKIHTAEKTRELNKLSTPPVLGRVEGELEKLFALNDGSSYAFYNAVESIGKYCTELQRIYADTEKNKLNDKDVSTLANQIIAINSAKSSFINHLHDKYPKKGQKWSKEDRERINALDAVSELVDAHDKALRRAMSSHGMEYGDVFLNINDILK